MLCYTNHKYKLGTRHAIIRLIRILSSNMTHPRYNITGTRSTFNAEMPFISNSNLDLHHENYSECEAKGVTKHSKLLSTSYKRVLNASLMVNIIIWHSPNLIYTQMGTSNTSQSPNNYWSKTHSVMLDMHFTNYVSTQIISGKIPLKYLQG